MRPGVAKGNYTGTVRVTTTDPAVQNKTVDVPVTYAALCSGFSVSPGTLNFNRAVGQHGVAVGGDRRAGANRLDRDCGAGGPNHFL